MRLLWLSHLVPWPPHGGVRQRSFHLMREAARRHDVHLLALNQRAALGEEALPEARRAFREFCTDVEVLPIPADASRLHWAAMVATGLARATPYDVNWLRSARFRRRCAALARDGGFDLVHVDTLGLAPHAAPFPPDRVVLNHHNVESHMMARRAERESGRLRRRYLAFEARRLAACEAAVCPRVALNLVVSELDGERLVEGAPGAPTAVVENGVDVDYFRPSGGAARPRSLVFAGGMSWYPNREAVLFLVREIWPALVARSPEHRLTVLGADAPPQLRAAAAADARIEVPGFVDDARPVVEAASVYVCPIRDGGGTRLKILDCLALARPLVATGLAVEGLGLAPGVHYLRAENPEEFVAAILRLEADPDLGRRLGAAGRAEVEGRFAWPVIGGHLEAAYAGVRSPRGAS